MKVRIFTLVLLTMMILGSFGVIPTLPLKVALEPTNDVQELPDIEEIPEEIGGDRFTRNDEFRPKAGK